MNAQTALVVHQVGLPALFLAVALGSLVPVLPTGATVSAAAGVAVGAGLGWSLAVVLAVAAAAAWVGDMVLFALTVTGGQHVGLPGRLRARVPPERLRDAERRMAEHGLALVIVSRLLPAGRIPVMVAAAALEVPWRRFAVADVPAAVVWAACYGAVGVVGGVLFPDPLLAAVAAVVLVVVIGLVRALLPRRTGARH